MIVQFSITMKWEKMMNNCFEVKKLLIIDMCLADLFQLIQSGFSCSVVRGLYTRRHD